MDEELGAHRRWIVLRTRAGRETWALENVEGHGFKAYLPRILERQNHYGQKLAIAAPLFPTYLFVFADRWRDLLSVFGIIGVIMRGTEPDFVPNRVIAEIRARESDGLVVLPKAKPQIGINSTVRVTNGPLCGHVGIVAGMREQQRVRVLLELMGRKTDVLFAERDLALVAA
jgi:transcriptional antiterminator RfaH